MTAAAALVGALAPGCAPPPTPSANAAGAGRPIDMRTPAGLRAQQTLDMLNSDWPIGPVGVATLATADIIKPVESSMEKLWWDRPFTLSGVDFGNVGFAFIFSFVSRNDVDDLMSLDAQPSDGGGLGGCGEQHGAGLAQTPPLAAELLVPVLAKRALDIARALAFRRELRPLMAIKIGERHLRALHAAAAHLALASAHLELPTPPLELFAEELRAAQEALTAITGEFTADDLLGAIFGRFCIGK